MEQPGPPPQVSESLRIIKDAIGFSGKFLMNKHQCESLTHRLSSIGEELKVLSKEYNDVGRTSDAVKVNYPAFEVLLTVLRKAEALLLKYRESTTSIIPSVLTRREDRQAFQEIHADLDMLNSFFHFDSFEYEASETMLTANADEDLKELTTSLDGLKQRGETRQVLDLARTLEKVKLVITEKSEGTSAGDLPSYLNIDPASVEIKDPVRIPERLSNRDDKKTDGWALVRFGTYLGCEFALKVFNSGDTTWNRRELLKEVRSLMQLHHPHVVQLMGFAQDEEKCIILMELMDTDLRHFMKQRSHDGKRPFSRSEEMDIITQIARGLLYLHEQGYVHGELKCSNILVKQIGDAFDVKISDLRSSQKLDVWDAVYFKERSSRGRSRWTAPEVTRYGESLIPTHELLKKADVYSFGMVCFEVVTGKLPFQDIRGGPLERQIATGELKQALPGELDGKLRALIESCWNRDPNARPTLEEICHLLDFIRSSQPAEANMTSGKAAVMRLFQLIPPILRLRGRRERPPAATSGHTELSVRVEDEVALPDFVRIDPKKLMKGRFLGEGASAAVHEATWLGCQFAMKTFKGRGASIAKEVKFLVELRHPCIVRLMGLAVHSERRCSIVMEFMGCSLRKLIDVRKRKRKIAHTAPFDLRETLRIVKRVAVGMAFLHYRGVTHRDLKADNVLVPDHPGSIDVKITDFGVSELIDPSEKPSRGAGTTFWRAPEMFPNPSDDQTPTYDLKAADVYSFAVTCYEVVSGRKPFEDEINEVGPTQVRLDVVRGLRPTLPCDLLPELKLLIEACWDGNPEKRPTFSTICQTLLNIQHGLQYS